MSGRRRRGRLRAWGLARRTVARDPGQALIIAILTALAAWAVLVTTDRAEDEVARLASRSAARHGSVMVTVSDGREPSLYTPEFPLVSR
ncbi:MAG: hypothetical protein ACOC1U_07365, partial [Spirochaetota bacterium]